MAHLEKIPEEANVCPLFLGQFKLAKLAPLFHAAFLLPELADEVINHL